MSLRHDLYDANCCTVLHTFLVHMSQEVCSTVLAPIRGSTLLHTRGLLYTFYNLERWDEGGSCVSKRIRKSLQYRATLAEIRAPPTKRPCTLFVSCVHIYQKKRHKPQKVCKTVHHRAPYRSHLRGV